MGFNPDDYEPVADRLERFWKDHPEGRVLTDLIQATGEQVIIRAEVYRDAADGRPWATGYAHEVPGEGNVNRTSALENCETSAVGRALANAGYAAKAARPSREEMQKTASQPRQQSQGQPGGLATQKQREFIYKLAQEKGLDEDAIKGLLPSNLTKQEASQTIEGLQGGAA